MNDIQIRIKELRKNKGHTQKEMATLLGISQQAYQQIESGRTEDMRVSTLKKLCDILEVSSDYVIGVDTTTAAKRVGDTTHLRKVARGRQLASAGLKPAKAKVTTEGKKHKYEIKG